MATMPKVKILVFRMPPYLLVKDATNGLALFLWKFAMTKRAELILIFSCAVLFFASFFWLPLFPVQRYPLFADAPKQYETYRIRTNDGSELPTSLLNLQNTYDGDPTFSVGRLPNTVYKWGQTLSEEDLAKHFSSLDEELFANIQALCIYKTIWGTLPDKSFGEIYAQRFVWKDKTLIKDDSTFKSVCQAEAPL
jgi:hypothetical protein